MRFLFVALITLLGGEILAVDTRIERVGGEFRVESLLSSNSGFVVTFASTDAKAKIKKIRLESNQVHVSVEEGKVLRLSAEVLSLRDGIAEASQVLLFLPTAGSYLPVWLLSRHKPSLSNLNGARYLDMHAPQSDFLLF